MARRGEGKAVGCAARKAVNRGKLRSDDGAAPRSLLMFFDGRRRREAGGYSCFVIAALSLTHVVNRASDHSDRIEGFGKRSAGCGLGRVRVEGASVRSPQWCLTTS
jgi:hypothetical protein